MEAEEGALHLWLEDTLGAHGNRKDVQRTQRYI
jgi:hypothetical protein